MSILDIGTGLGIYIYRLSQHAPDAKFIGIDIDEENLRQARNIRGNSELILMSAENLGFRDNTFDAVLMIEVLEHISNDKKSIAEIYRVLKPRGKLIVTAPNKLFPFETHGFRIGSKIYGTKGFGFPLLTYLPERLRRYLANVRVYTLYLLKKLLAEEGFSIDCISFLAPGLDQLRINFPNLSWLITLFQSLLDKIENSPIKCFLTTIIICAEKCE